VKVGAVELRTSRAFCVAGNGYLGRVLINRDWHLASFSEMPPKDDARPVFQPASKANSMQWNRRRSINPA